MDEVVLGKRLQTMRKSKGLTQQVLCHKANLSYSTLAKIERGAIKAPSIFTIQAIANVLSLSLDELVGNRLGGGSLGRQLRRTASGVSFVYFDIHGSLIRGSQRVFTQLAEETGALPEVIETTYWHYNDEVCRGTMSMSDFNAALSKRLGATIDWQAAYLQAATPIEPMQELLRWAAERYKVGLLSNIMPGLLTALRRQGLLPDIAYDAVVDSSEVGAIKPEPQIYDTATRLADCPPTELLLIDDTRGNLRAAEKLGWRVLQFDGFAPEESVERLRAALQPAD